MIFFVGDTHFGHANIITYCNRPFLTVQDMNEKLIQNWNRVVQPADTVIHLGDFSFLKDDKAKEICAQLNGHKVLVRGNHDRQTGVMQQIGVVYYYIFCPDKHCISNCFLTHTMCVTKSSNIKSINTISTYEKMVGASNKDALFVFREFVSPCGFSRTRKSD